MTSLIPDGDDPLTRAEVRQLEGRADARFHAVNARFTTTDRRFAGVVNRIDEGEQRCRSLAERFAAHNEAVDGRFDATDVRVDEVHDETFMQLEQARRELFRILVVVIAGMTVVLPSLTWAVAWVWLR